MLPIAAFRSAARFFKCAQKLRTGNASGNLEFLHVLIAKATAHHVGSRGRRSSLRPTRALGVHLRLPYGGGRVRRFAHHRRNEDRSRIPQSAGCIVSAVFLQNPAAIVLATGGIFLLGALAERLVNRPQSTSTGRASSKQ